MTSTSFLSLILLGIPGQEVFYLWIFLSLLFMYFITFIGNCTLLIIVKADTNLQIPMYMFLSMLAMIDLGLSLVTLPTVLGVFWLHSVEVPLRLCLSQMFLIHFFSVMESSVLLAMAYDRYIAICNPLRYSSIITNRLIGKIGFLAVIRGMATLLPIPVLLQSSVFCKKNILSHVICLHPDLMRLVCNRHMANNLYSLFAVLSTMGIDLMLLIISYVLILKAICNLGSMSECSKVFHNCACHVCVALLFYTPMISLSMVHRFGGHISPTINVPMAYLHFLMPPALNPIMYGIKMRQIRQKIFHKIEKIKEHCLGKHYS
ncbi:olfactory receptor 51G2-like [Bombina bombina]|uniref:olfactory receptor 51G2-like n=1 Tax=Bombina bombina TaxID=8345 RepID=UPI00235A9831|nr:olfactory receptor 51G2-like [Bombina bombina]